MRQVGRDVSENTSMTEVYHCSPFGAMDWRVLLGKEVGAKCTFLVGMRFCPQYCQQGYNNPSTFGFCFIFCLTGRQSDAV